MVKCLSFLPCLTIKRDLSGNVIWSESIVIDHTGPSYIAFNFFVTFCCLVSSYMYVAMAAFRITESNPLMFFIMMIFEAIFVCDLCINFLLSYTPEHSSNKKDTERDIFKIWMHYLHGSFYLDIIPLIPFQALTMKRGRNTLFYLIKMIRLYNGFEIFDVPKLLDKVKKFYRENAQDLINRYPLKANDTHEDHNKVEDLLRIGYCLKISKLVIVIGNFSYLLAMFWFIMCKFIEDVIYDADYSNPEDAAEHPFSFIVFYNLQDKEIPHTIITLTYFAFTSLSTVGFGDYCPRSNVERMVGAFMLLCGVAIFSYIMGMFINILQQHNKFAADFEEGLELLRFFGVIKKFNSNLEIDGSVKKRIEAHFEYKWKNDKNLAF